MPNVRAAVVLSALSQYSVSIVQIVTMLILARLLTPAEIGVFAIASGVIMLATFLRELGVTQYIIREEEITDAKIRAATGVMMLSSWTLGALIAFAAPYIAHFYGEPELAEVLWVCVLAFLLAPFASVPFAVLTRNLQFGPLFHIGLAAALTNSVCAIGLVWFGMSYMGLAWASIAGAVVQLVAIIHYTDKRIPVGPSLRHANEILKFGIIAVGGTVLRRLSPNLPDLILGRVATMNDVGIFSRGFGAVLFLNELCIQALKPVVLPYLSSVHRDGQSVADAYRRACVLQTAVTWPMCAGVNLLALPMILLLFGEQWRDAAPLATIIALWGALQAVHCFASDALLAVGKEMTMLVMETVLFVTRLSVLLIAAPHGLEAVAWALVLTAGIELIVGSCAVYSGFGLGMLSMLRALVPSAFVAVTCWTCVWVSLNGLAQVELDGTLAMFISVVICGPVWLASLFLSRHPLADEVKRFLASRLGWMSAV